MHRCAVLPDGAGHGLWPMSMSVGLLGWSGVTLDSMTFTCTWLFKQGKCNCSSRLWHFCEMISHTALSRSATEVWIPCDLLHGCPGPNIPLRLRTHICYRLCSSRAACKIIDKPQELTFQTTPCDKVCFRCLMMSIPPE